MTIKFSLKVWHVYLLVVCAYLAIGWVLTGIESMVFGRAFFLTMVMIVSGIGLVITGIHLYDEKKMFMPIN